MTKMFLLVTGFSLKKDLYTDDSLVYANIDQLAKELRVEISHIESYESTLLVGSAKTLICLTSGQKIVVKETVEQLDKALSESYVFVKKVSLC